MIYTVKGALVRFRTLSLNDSDTELVLKWRNTKSAQESFLCHRVFTREIHEAFMRSKPESEYLWVVERPLTDLNKQTIAWEPIGMCGINVRKDGYSESARLFMDESVRGEGLGKEAAFLRLSFAFDVLELPGLFGIVRKDNFRKIAFDCLMGWQFSQDVPECQVPAVKLIYPRGRWKGDIEWLFSSILSARRTK